MTKHDGQHAHFLTLAIGQTWFFGVILWRQIVAVPSEYLKIYWLSYSNYVHNQNAVLFFKMFTGDTKIYFEFLLQQNIDKVPIKEE
jgi:hypothetical protein